ncbi:hypothetical protein IFM89_022684 [Coptis chinensis]|uniref:Uncharacterized protein n=1 Tax=Coptis chinensis TaxID=261450 RepID=A0A835H4N1_9MAGN|nr:hypothetical protein IFM89_022684 [Coptis chinensis]
MGLLHQRRELACEMADNELIPAVRDVIERLEKKHTRYKVKPEDVVQPPPLERHSGRPKKQRIRGDDEEKATRKYQSSKKSRKADKANEAEDNEPKVGNTENNEDERAEEVVAKGGHDSPTRTRGGDNNVNVQLVIDVPEAEVQNLQNDVPRARRGGRAGRVGGRKGAGQHVNLQPLIDVPEAEPEAENLQVPEARRGGRTGRAEAANVRRYGTRIGTGRGGGRGLGCGWVKIHNHPRHQDNLHLALC